MNLSAFRYVGLEALPKKLTDTEIETYFQLSPDEVAAIKEFDRRFWVPIAVQVVAVRATGRFAPRRLTAPRHLLGKLSRQLGVPSPDILSVNSAYKREATKFEHQRWIKNKLLQLKDYSSAVEAELLQALTTAANGLSTRRDIVRAAEHWLFEASFLLPATSTLEDVAKRVARDFEHSALEDIKRVLPKKDWPNLLKTVYASYEEGKESVVEWLKAGPARHGPQTLETALKKERFLRKLGVDKWELPSISLERMEGYALDFFARPPSESRKRLEETQILEAVSFLRCALLDVVEQAADLVIRQSRNIANAASAAAIKKRTATEPILRQAMQRALDALCDESKPQAERIAIATAALKEHLQDPTSKSFEGQVRISLVDQSPRVRSLMREALTLPLQGDEQSRAMKQVRALQDLYGKNANELPIDFAVPVRLGWRDLVNDSDRKRAFKAFEASAMMELRRSLRGTTISVPTSRTFRAREDMLIPPQDWEKNKSSYLKLLRMDASGRSFVDRVTAQLNAGLAALQEGLAKGAFRISAAGDIELPKEDGVGVEPEALATRSRLFEAIGNVQLPDMLVEMDAATGFSRTLLGRVAKDESELVTAYAALVAHGTELDAKGVSQMIPNVSYRAVLRAMNELERGDRLRKANRVVLDFQSRLPITEHWGESSKASSDMMALGASRHIYDARTDPNKRVFAKGIYTHVRQTYGIFADRPIVLNERQDGPALAGLQDYNSTLQQGDRLAVKLLAVDTHGYTHASMAVAKILGYDLYVRLKQLSERKIYVPRGWPEVDGLEPVLKRQVSVRKILDGWDGLMRFCASIALGHVDPAVALRRLNSSSDDDPVLQAAEHLGMLLRSVFLCDYHSNPTLRAEIRALLNRGETVHTLQRCIHFGSIDAARGRRQREMVAISGAHALLTNLVIAWNTWKMNEIVPVLRSRGIRLEDDWLRRIGPGHYEHINFRGVMTFNLKSYRAVLLQPAGQGYRAAS